MGNQCSVQVTTVQEQFVDHFGTNNHTNDKNSIHTHHQLDSSSAAGAASAAITATVPTADPKILAPTTPTTSPGAGTSSALALHPMRPTATSSSYDDETLEWANRRSSSFQDKE